MNKYRLKLMADYQCFPIWGNFGNHEGNIDPALLPITDGLKMMLNEWQTDYDDTLNLDDPIQSGFATAEAERAFEDQGLLIWKKLSTQLGESCQVEYFSDLKGKEFASESDYLSN